MALESAAQLLATVLLLLQTVHANPALSQSVRDQAQTIAQSAITEATKAIGKPNANASLPSCTIHSDKYNYRVGEVVVLDYAATNAKKLEFIQASSDVFPTLEGELLGLSGQYRKQVNEVGYVFLTMKATNAGGASSACSMMVNVH